MIYVNLYVFFCLSASGLRTPLAVPCSYPGPFGMVPHPGMNGELGGAGAAYTGLHNISPQMSAVAAAAVAAYGRTQVVPEPLINSKLLCIFFCHFAQLK